MATVAEIGDCHQKRRLSPFWATVFEFGDKLSPFPATIAEFGGYSRQCGQDFTGSGSLVTAELRAHTAQIKNLGLKPQPMPNVTGIDGIVIIPSYLKSIGYWPTKQIGSVYCALSSDWKFTYSIKIIVNPDFIVVVLYVVLDEVVLHVHAHIFLYGLSIFFLELVGVLQHNVSKYRVYTMNKLGKLSSSSSSFNFQRYMK